ncbi:hypothetical protein Tco_0420845 [Tanacetum coccineum]
MDATEAPSPAKRLKAGKVVKKRTLNSSSTGPLPPVVIREPGPGEFQPLPEVQGKGKEKVSEEQAAQVLLNLQTPKKKNPAEQFIFQRCTPATTEPSSLVETSSLYAELGLTVSETDFDEEVSPETNVEAQEEGQGGTNPVKQMDEDSIARNLSKVQANLKLPLKECETMRILASSAATLISAGIYLFQTLGQEELEFLMKKVGMQSMSPEMMKKLAGETEELWRNLLDHKIQQLSKGSSEGYGIILEVPDEPKDNSAVVAEKQAGNVQTNLTLSSAELEIQSMVDVPIHQEDLAVQRTPLIDPVISMVTEKTASTPTPPTTQAHWVVNSLVHSLRALSTLRRSSLRTASTTAKPCQGDSSKFYLITGSIYTDLGEPWFLGNLIHENMMIAEIPTTQLSQLDVVYSDQKYEHAAVMSSTSLAVTYTSVYTDSEPGRAFWGADDEEKSEGGPEDPQTPPVPQDEDEREPMFVQAHDPDFVPKPIYPEYIPLEDEHEFPAEEQPLPLVDSPTAESPGYITESDPEEDPEEYEDDETEDGPADYPMDGGDDGDDDDDDSSRDDANDEDEDDDEEEEEHLAPADSTIVVPVDEPVFPPKGTEPVIPSPSTDITIGARITVRPQTSISLPPGAEVEKLLAMTTPSPSPPISLSPPSAGERLARYTAPPAHLSPPPVLGYHFITNTQK